MDLEKILIRKKDRALQEYSAELIINAIKKSAARCEESLKDNEISEILSLVEKKLLIRSNNIVSLDYMHTLVINALQEIRQDVADSYIQYRNWIKKNAEEFDKIYQECQSIQFLGDKTNANADSTLVSTKRVKKLDILMKKQYQRYFLTQREIQAADDGYIYPHDQSARLDTMNCSLFDIEAVLTGGFEMSNTWYNEPKTLATAFDVIGDIVLMAASQQYGGFTIPEVDKILEPYANKTLVKYYDEILADKMEEMKDIEELVPEYAFYLQTNNEIYKQLVKKAKEKSHIEAMQKLFKDMKQGVQGWEYKFNTVASSRGDYPFITTTFGLTTSEIGKMISTAFLDVRREGQGKEGFKKPVLFPKLVFLYDENIHGKGKESETLFEAGIKCSAKTMYPDWLSLSGEGYIASMYKKYGKVISPMGCRAFLSPWYEKGGLTPADESDNPVFVGRFNIGAVSLHLPMILAKARKQNENFYEVLDYYLELIRQIHIRTYQHLGQMKASMNPLGFCESGFYGGHLQLNDKIAPVLKSATASFGITALNELQELYNGKSLVEDGQFALEVMDHINEKINEFKNEDGNLYAVYGTPAESLCGTQVQQFRKLYGIVKNVSDREYMSNSFHCHVTEVISPIEKQNLEYRFWEKLNGGKIQYVKYKLNYNVESFRILIRRAMDMGFYEGANLELSYCDDCGHEELDMEVCPACGSLNLTKIDRMNGYLSYSRVHGDTRLNDAKMAEIKERISM